MSGSQVSIFHGPRIGNITISSKRNNITVGLCGSLRRMTLAEGSRLGNPTRAVQMFHGCRFLPCSNPSSRVRPQNLNAYPDVPYYCCFTTSGMRGCWSRDSSCHLDAILPPARMLSTGLCLCGSGLGPAQRLRIRMRISRRENKLTPASHAESQTSRAIVGVLQAKAATIVVCTPGIWR